MIMVSSNVRGIDYWYCFFRMHSWLCVGSTVCVLVFKTWRTKWCDTSHANENIRVRTTTIPPI